jgi:OOP family OmpA-OmpF porin
MKMTLALFLLTLLLHAVPATSAEKGGYIGIGAGQVAIEVDNVYGTGFDFDENDTGFKLFGGYRFLPWLAVEGIYLNGGSPDISETVGVESASLSVETQTFVGAVIFALPIGQSFELFVKPGFAYWDSETKLSYSRPGFMFNDSDDDQGGAFFLGVGAEWSVDNFGFRLEYEYFDVSPEYNWDTNEFENDLDATARVMSLNLIYKF